MDDAKSVEVLPNPEHFDCACLNFSLARRVTFGDAALATAAQICHHFFVPQATIIFGVPGAYPLSREVLTPGKTKYV